MFRSKPPIELDLFELQGCIMIKQVWLISHWGADQ